MQLIQAVNVNDAYRAGLRLVNEIGVLSPSRNGPVKVVSEPVTTRYTHPRQRVLFDAQRDANPFFHLFEALWMLAGRNDLATMTYFLPSFAQFSDNGQTLYGAYGFRWRRWFSYDQLLKAAAMLGADLNSRRVVVAMWDGHEDLGATSKDIPCNDLINFSIVQGRLDMYVFCRSNDIVYGCYGANAVHLSFLQEYMAAMVGVPVGAYEQISANFHAYVERPYRLEQYWPLMATRGINPYLERPMEIFPLVQDTTTFDSELRMIAEHFADGSFGEMNLTGYRNLFFENVAQPMYIAHHMYKTTGNTISAAEFLAQWSDSHVNGYVDWFIAGKEWLLRRKMKKSKHAFGAAFDIRAHEIQP